MDKDTLSDVRDEFKLCKEAESEQRKASQDDLEFALLDKQWDERDIDQRREERRPCLTINRLPSFIKHVTNDGRMNPPSIIVKPVGSGANKDTAGILSDLIRNIETSSQADIVYGTAFDFAVSGGVGYFRVNVDYACDDEWDQDISLSRISNPFSVFGDYEGKEATSIDWNRAFVTDWYSKASFEAKWGKDAKALSFDVDGATYDEDWFEDKRIRVAEYWTRSEVDTELIKFTNGMVLLAPEAVKLAPVFELQGVSVKGTRPTKTYKVRQKLVTAQDVLEENDWLGKYIPIVPMYGEEVNVNGKRYFISLIRRAKDSQRAFNYHRTKSAEMGMLQTRAPWFGPVGMFSTDPNWLTANRQNHPYLEYDVVPEQPQAVPQRVPFATPDTASLQEAANSQDDMKSIMGIYDPSLGERSNEVSGKAINARTRQTDISTFDFLDNRNRSVEHGGRIIIDLIPKVYSVERVMRCVQEDGTPYAVPVNQPVAPAQELQKFQQSIMPPMPGAMPMGPMQPPMQQDEPSGPPQYVPVPPQMQEGLMPAQAEQLRKILKTFDLTTGKYDVTVTAGPGYATRREQAAEEMMEFIRVFPQSAPIIGDLLAKNLDWPGSEQVAARLKAMLPPQADGAINAMVQQLQKQLQAQDAAAKDAVAKLSMQIQVFQKQLADKAREDKIKEYEAVNGRITALANAAKAGIQVTVTAMGDMQAVPLEKPLDPETAVEAQLRTRDQNIATADLALRAEKQASEHTRDHAQAFTDHERAATERVQAGTDRMNAVADMHRTAQSEAQEEPTQGPGMDGSVGHESAEGEPPEPGEMQNA